MGSSCLPTGFAGNILPLKCASTFPIGDVTNSLVSIYSASLTVHELIDLRAVKREWELYESLMTRLERVFSSN